MGVEENDAGGLESDSPSDATISQEYQGVERLGGINRGQPHGGEEEPGPGRSLRDGGVHFAERRGREWKLEGHLGHFVLVSSGTVIRERNQWAEKAVVEVTQVRE
jgi:hypothetical protein